MSRSGYTDDYDYDDPLALGRWRSAVRNAIRGKRGQKFLNDLAAALDAMPEKKLAADVWEVPEHGMPFSPRGGDVCALGVIAKARGIDTSRHDPDDDSAAEIVGSQLNIATAMAREIIWVNDEASAWPERVVTQERRWQIVREWVREQIKQER